MHYTPFFAAGFAALAVAAPAPAPRDHHRGHGFGDVSGFFWWGWSTGTAGAPAPTWAPEPFPSGSSGWPTGPAAAASSIVPAASSAAALIPVAVASSETASTAAVVTPPAATSEAVVPVTSAGAITMSVLSPEGSSSAAPVAASSSTEVVTSAAASASSSYTSIAIQQHNIHRANHSAADLTYNTEIAGYAAILAATCVFNHNTSIGTGEYGQNLAATAAAADANSALAEGITNGWYNDEINNFSGLYGHESPDMTNFENWGHFTQVVWLDTQSVGCATQLCAAGTIYSDYESYYTVCNYLAAGNYIGEFADNVKEPLGQATTSVA